jgi:hypothetical protein
MEASFRYLAGDWRGDVFRVDGAIIALVATTALTYIYWGNIFAKKVPRDFWFGVPQATGEFAGKRQQRADERCIEYVFDQHVRHSRCEKP